MIRHTSVVAHSDDIQSKLREDDTLDVRCCQLMGRVCPENDWFVNIYSKQ